jgi:hypothetical protein
MYIFCQEDTGDIALVTIDKAGEVAKRVILKNSADTVQNIIIHPIIQEDGITIIYNQPSEERGSCLYKRRLTDEGWEAPERIDYNRGGVFEVQRLGRDHILLFYQTRGTEWNLCCREITPNKTGALKSIFSTNYHIADTSFLTTQDAIHALFVVKNMFGSQLIYRRNATGEFSAPLVLNEAQRLENCLLYIVRGKLYVSFMQAGSLFFCVSCDMGATFDRPRRYLSKFCHHPAKARYVSEEPMSGQTLYCQQIYVDKRCPWDAQIIPDMYENFYISAPQNDVPDEKSEDLRRELTRLREQVSAQNKQILSLANMLKQRGDASWFGYGDYNRSDYLPQRGDVPGYDEDYILPDSDTNGM